MWWRNRAPGKNTGSTSTTTTRSARRTRRPASIPAELEFCGGNHVSTYGLRARGSKWVYLGQTVNNVYHSLVVRPDSGINGVRDIRGKKLGGVGSHPILNNWLYLKQRGLDQDRDDYELVLSGRIQAGHHGSAGAGKETAAALALGA